MNTRQKNSNKRNQFSILLPILSIIGIGIITVISSAYEKSWTYNWDGIRGNIKDSIKSIEYRSITSGIGGNGRSTIDEVLKRRWIMNKATESELLKLIEYPNGTVKAIAYEGLIRKRNFKQKTELILQGIHDTNYQVSYQSGCEGWNMEIGEYLVRNVLMIDSQIAPYPPELINDFAISELDKEKILTEFRKRISI